MIRKAGAGFPKRSRESIRVNTRRPAPPECGDNAAGTVDRPPILAILYRLFNDLPYFVQCEELLVFCASAG